MSIIRVEKNKNYTAMSNYHLREKNMSLKAKGLLSWMLSNDDSWDYSIAGIVANCKENETAIKSTLKELQEFGYLEVIKKTPNKEVSTIHYEYIVHEQPQGIENQDIENLSLDNLCVENQVQRNTNKRNTNKRTISKDNTHPLIDLISANKEKKPNQYQKCLELVQEFTDDTDLQDKLMQFYKICNENSREANVPFYTNTFKGKLNKLKQLSTDTREQIDIVLQTLDNGWNSFYELKQNTRRTGNVSRDIEHLDGYEVKLARKDRSNGKAEKF